MRGRLARASPDGRARLQGLFGDFGRPLRAAGGQHRLLEFAGPLAKNRLPKHPFDQPSQLPGRAVAEGRPQAHARKLDPRPHARLIVASRQGDHGHAAADRLDARC